MFEWVCVCHLFSRYREWREKKGGVLFLLKEWNNRVRVPLRVGLCCDVMQLPWLRYGIAESPRVNTVYFSVCCCHTRHTLMVITLCDVRCVTLPLLDVRLLSLLPLVQLMSICRLVWVFIWSVNDFVSTDSYMINTVIKKTSRSGCNYWRQLVNGLCLDFTSPVLMRSEVLYSTFFFHSHPSTFVLVSYVYR